MNGIEHKNKTRSRWTLVLLAAVFIAPILLAYIVYKNKSLIPSGSVSHGNIISPARPLSNFSLKTIKDIDFVLEDIRRKWSYVYIVESQCDAACLLNLKKMRNARIAQGAEARRVNYYLVFTSKPEAQAVSDEFMQTYPKLTVLYGTETDTKPFLEMFAGSVQMPIQGMNRVYMIDPIGNYMMYYENGFDSLGIMEDLKFLLKASQIG